ncbi:PREDICTED: uncharacterized protein LOC107066044 isoform X2 [Polistes dominula]|uniref:Uncharacterized protein LOC107066044 isoform X2 n=1 Tax=Polistes dominula TaxID=743375 RepID=A0ABM1I6D2_POLDO|nr:PREDICTED: uncharacterized protein LOC107066044 isoform X2 [Polistes dominula]
MNSRRICIRRIGRVFLILCCLELSLKACSAESNVTRSNSSDEEEDEEPEITFDEFKERYRRLIPYIAFYAANNNHLNVQWLSGKNLIQQVPSNDVSSSRRSYQYPFSRINGDSRNVLNNYRPTSNNNVQNQLRKFIPSVQYDPNDGTTTDTDYFIPIRYNSKINQEDYSTSVYNSQQEQKQSHIEVNNPVGEILSKDYRYNRPIRPYLTSNTREYVNRNQGLKSTHTNLPQDYNTFDHTSGSTNGKPIVEINYPSENIDSIRYLPQPVISTKGIQQQTINILDNPSSSSSTSTSTSGRQQVNLPTRNLNFINFNPILESFQLAERLPEALDKNNLDDSIKTLIEILNILHNAKKEEFPQVPPPPPVLSTIPGAVRPPPIQRLPNNYYPTKIRPNTRPKVITESRFPTVPASLLIPDDPDRFKPTSSYVNEVKTKIVIPPTYTLDDYKSTPTYNDNEFRVTPKIPVQQSSYTFNNENNGRYTIPHHIVTDPTTTMETQQSVAENNPISTPKPELNNPSLKYGVTRGKPNVDYPTYSVIPETEFSCKKQRYKGFFGDPSTGCQVWHYCDLNGGKSSFLCPNGTIFSQVALTCDWWFNVKCESTTQLYVLNERLYKYILPIMPKFPEDFTGPEVDRYLEFKFKEMEAKLKEKKLKKQQERKDKAKNKIQSSDNNNKNRE